MATISAHIPIAATKIVQKSRRNIPASLIREVVVGVPFYFEGYRSVINKSKKLEDIMGDSGLQTLLKNTLGDYLKSQIDRKDYYVFAGETGSHINENNNFGLDIAIYDRKILTPDKITVKYISVPPKVVMEIDVKVELPHGNMFEQYILPKIQQLFAFGTERVIWIFTQSKTIIYASAAEQWAFPKWESDLEIMEGVTLNVAQILETEGIKIN